MKKAAATRITILEKAFELIYTKGYQTTSIDEIIATTQVTKGAFYYHFKNKDEMGLAVINEVLKPTMLNSFIQPLQQTKKPLDTIYKMMETLLLKTDILTIAHGCPAGNLTQEMTPWNAPFSEALAELTDQWKTTLTAAIDQAKKAGQARKNVQPVQVATWIMAGYWGVRNLGKLYNSNDCYHSYLKELKSYLNSLQ